jgi:hypothetical protein
MALLEVQNNNRVTLKLTLPCTTAERLNAYASFTKGTPSDVTDAALRYIFDKDKEFADYLATNPDLPEQLLVVKRQTRNKKHTAAN